MDAWGPGSFQNDAAVEWLVELEGEDEQYVLDALSAVAEADDGERIDEETAAIAIAAAEVVAASRGKAAPRVPETIPAWIEDNEEAFEDEDVLLARGAVERVKGASDLQRKWFDDEAKDDWIWMVDRLLARLS